MAAMTDSIALAPGRPFTAADLELMPDDGKRYELIDGVLIVSPSPSWAHQEMAGSVFRTLWSACPDDFRVLVAPFDVRTDESNVVEPDVLVARYADLTAPCLPVAPVLAVEILSPSTQLHDRNTKKAHYERIGTASYWLLDPGGDGAVHAYDLDDAGHFTLVATASGDEVVTAERPFPVQICPARLLDGLRAR